MQTKPQHSKAIANTIKGNAAATNAVNYAATANAVNSAAAANAIVVSIGKTYLKRGKRKQQKEKKIRMQRSTTRDLNCDVKLPKLIN